PIAVPIGPVPDADAEAVIQDKAATGATATRERAVGTPDDAAAPEATPVAAAAASTASGIAPTAGAATASAASAASGVSEPADAEPLQRPLVLPRVARRASDVSGGRTLLPRRARPPTHSPVSRTAATSRSSRPCLPAVAARATRSPCS